MASLSPPCDFYPQLQTVGLRVEWTLVNVKDFFIALCAPLTNQRTDALSFICPLHCLYLTQQLKYKVTFGRNNLLMQPCPKLYVYGAYHKAVLSMSSF